MRSREYTIRRIANSFQYSRDDAEKVYEMMQVRKYEVAWGAAFGGFFAFKANAWCAEAAHSIRVFRKPWMRYTIQAAVFGAAYYCGLMVPSKILGKFDKGGNVMHQYRGYGVSGVTTDSMLGRSDMVQRFRLFDEQTNQSLEEKTANYLA
jgi:hypothetical protein